MRSEETTRALGILEDDFFTGKGVPSFPVETLMIFLVSSQLVFPMQTFYYLIRGSQQKKRASRFLESCVIVILIRCADVTFDGILPE